MTIFCGLRQDEISVFSNVAILQHPVITSLRQAAEWGMRALEGTLGRLKVQLTSQKCELTRFNIVNLFIAQF